MMDINEVAAFINTNVRHIRRLVSERRIRTRDVSPAKGTPRLGSAAAVRVEAVCGLELLQHLDSPGPETPSRLPGVSFIAPAAMRKRCISRP